MNDHNASDLDVDGGPPETRKTCDGALASQILGSLGILSFLGILACRPRLFFFSLLLLFYVFLGIPALLLGFEALKKVRKSRGTLVDKNRAIFGIVTGSVHTVSVSIALCFAFVPMVKGCIEALRARERVREAAHQQALMAPEWASKSRCMDNLKRLLDAADGALNKDPSGPFPFRGEDSLAFFQTMVDHDPKRLTPELFLCPDGKETAAERQADGTFELSAETCSYEIALKRGEDTTQVRAIVIYERAPYHNSSRSVLSSRHGGAVWVRSVKESDFQRYLAEALGN